jgi:CshA-type fibril repeat protein
MTQHNHRVFSLSSWRKWSGQPLAKLIQAKAILACLLLWQPEAFAQTFACDGQFYLAQNNPTQYFIVNTETNSLDPLFTVNPSGQTNGIGLNVVDGFIYGIDPGNGNVFRVDSSGNTTNLGNDGGDIDAAFVGDVDENGIYYTRPAGNRIQRIDVSGSTATLIADVTLSAAAQGADFAFNPIDNNLYSFQPNNSADIIYQINPTTGSVNQFLVTNLDFPGGNTAGAVYFDEFGVFYVYINQTGELYRIELDLTNETGTANPSGPFATGDVVSLNDGTSCPYTLGMQKSVDPTSVSAGQTVTYTYRISNQNLSDVNSIDFEDILPADGRTFVAGTLNNPFGGTVNAFGGTNTLEIIGINVSGDSVAEITVDVLIPANATPGIVTNQAFLRDVPVGFGGPNIPSDFPPTGERSDETPLEILPPVGNPPTAVDDTASTPPDTPATFSVTDNDTDPDDNLDPSTVDLDPSTAGIQDTFTVPGEGTFTVDSTGDVTFTPESGFTGTVTIPYTVQDTTGLPSNQANITVTVGNPPVANPDSTSTLPDTNTTFSVTDNDTDPDNNLDPSTVDLDPNTDGIQDTFTVPGQGVFTVDSAGNVSFDPDPAFTGTVTIPYTVQDDTGLTSNEADISVTVGNGPDANDDLASTSPNTPVTFSVTDNDTDPDDNLDPSTVDLDPSTAGIQDSFTVPGQGTFTVDNTGDVTFTPEPGFTGTVTIPYTVQDTTGLTSNQANITVTIGNPPVANPDSRSTPAGSPVLIEVLANDSDPDNNLDPTSVSVTSGPSNGQVSVDPVTGSITYTPDPGFTGTDTFTYEVCDTTSPTPLCDTASVTVTVTPSGGGGTNQPPIANNDNAYTPPGAPVTIPVLDNDADPENALDPASVTVTSGPSNGQVSVDPTTGDITYTPDPGFTGTDIFTYEVCDAANQCSSANVTVIVDDAPPANQPPVAVSDRETIPAGGTATIPVLQNDSDPDNNLDPTSVSVIGGPTNGTVTVNPDGSITYTPDLGFTGSDIFTYQVCDSGNPTLCATASVVITVQAGPTPPPPSGDAVLLVKRITAINGIAIPGFVEDASDDDDNSAAWPDGPASFLLGALQESIGPQDTVEYSIYFLLPGQAAPKSIVLCDPLPTRMSYRSNLIVEIDGNSQSLTDAGGDDAGSFVIAGGSAPTSCEETLNPSGIVVVDLGALAKTEPVAGVVRFEVVAKD